MKITNTKVDELNYRLHLEIVKEDYAEKKRKTLARIRRDAEIKGFRKGMAPASLIERLYGERVLADCPGLRFVRVNGAGTDLDASALQNSEQAVLLCPSDSLALQAAKENGWQYIVE